MLGLSDSFDSTTMLEEADGQPAGLDSLTSLSKIQRLVVNPSTLLADNGLPLFPSLTNLTHLKMVFDIYCEPTLHRLCVSMEFPCTAYHPRCVDDSMLCIQPPFIGNRSFSTISAQPRSLQSAAIQPAGIFLD